MARTLRQASLVRGRDGIKLFREQGLDAGAADADLCTNFGP